ncbi:hypothetical protein PV08_05110 [Exophiala spinifera]|uniref:Major facilitator superfamily (MFS) profile domain-containing protein n=1 Tax=Exophiala spinifera TaxID=91928 RepID=A0A0D2BH15_9EURO|nr:uncharacterized protein PV08_05110 [Exophiala spinifera]KIW17915.1 hypothetical protein PV08_05110 [Exophiala spinifera]
MAGANPSRDGNNHNLSETTSISSKKSDVLVTTRALGYSPPLPSSERSSLESSSSCPSSTESLMSQSSSESRRGYETFPPGRNEDDLEEATPADMDKNKRDANGKGIVRIIMVLTIGVFIFHADSSLVMATHPTIASEFDALHSSSWLFTAFALAGAATQNTVSKLGDIFGHKRVILTCYLVFAIGWGLGQSMPQVIFGRIISGSVGAGMTVLVSLIITALVPIRQVASWRAFVNILSTLGRSIGAPLGGWLADRVGWRFSFIGQAPLMLVAMVCVWFIVPSDVSSKEESLHTGDQERESRQLSLRERLGRLDFLGALVLGLLILSLLLPLEVGGVNISWRHPAIPTLILSSVILLGLFIGIEKRWAKDPVLPLEIFSNKYAVYSFGIMALQVAAQAGLMFSVPLYFQVTERLSNTQAGARLFPAILGNTVASILSGVMIQRTGKYKNILILGTLLSGVSYILVLFRWNGNTSLVESLYIIPGGFGTGLVLSAAFISLQAAVTKETMSPAISALYLFTGLGSILGLAFLNVILQGVLRSRFESRLVDLGVDIAKRKEIISKATATVDYIDQLPTQLAQALIGSYVHALKWMYSES